MSTARPALIDDGDLTSGSELDEEVSRDDEHAEEGDDLSSEEGDLDETEKLIKQGLRVESAVGDDDLPSARTGEDYGLRVRATVRYMAAIVLVCAILISTTASKISFLVVAHRFRNATNVSGSHHPPVTGPNVPQPVVDTELGVNFACLFLFLLLPHGMVLLVSLWSGALGKKTDNFPWPTTTALIWVSRCSVVPLVST